MKIRLIKTERDFEFPFPGGAEVCPNAVFFSVGLGAEERFKMVLGYTSREAHGHDRRRVNVGIQVGSGYRAVVEFVGTDDYKRTGDCICLIKNPESNEWLTTDEPVPLEYAGHRVVVYERHIAKGGGDHWGILVNEGEIDDMLRVGLIRAGHKGLRETP